MDGSSASRGSRSPAPCWRGLDAPHADPWLILTDLPPEAADACWYRVRRWIECGFKDTKRGGWHGEQTKMTDPARAARLWLAIAVVTLWVLSAGSAAEEELGPASTLPDLPLSLARDTASTRRSRPRLRERVPPRATHSPRRPPQR